MVDEIVTALEDAAPVVADLEAKGELEEQERQRVLDEEQRKRRQTALEEAWRESVKESRESLLHVVERWVTARHIEQFLADLETRAAAVEPAKEDSFTERFKKARELFGGTDAASHFEHWSTPDQVFEVKRRKVW
jgi:reverse gyrase